MKRFFLFTFLIADFIFLSKAQTSPETVIIAEKAKEYHSCLDKEGRIHTVWTNEYSLYYTVSTDGGKTFSKPILIDKGNQFRYLSPHIAANEEHIIILSANNKNIFSWRKLFNDSEWESTVKVNDLDGVVTENLVSADGGKGDFFFSVWVDERQKGSFTIFGTYSIDGGMTWAKSKNLYKSPDGSICPCCKPTVSIYRDSVYVMFRNDVNGNRNMYLMLSEDEGINFGQAKKLGLGTWQINGCPVDGGGMAIDEKGKVMTAWKRATEIFVCQPDKPEQKAGMGRMCKIANTAKGDYLIWQSEGEIILWSKSFKGISLGMGFKPGIIGSAKSNVVYCFWIDDKDRLQFKVIDLIKLFNYF